MQACNKPAATIPTSTCRPHLHIPAQKKGFKEHLKVTIIMNITCPGESLRNVLSEIELQVPKLSVEPHLQHLSCVEQALLLTEMKLKRIKQFWKLVHVNDD